MISASTGIPAAALILLRTGGAAGFEALLARRSTDGAYRFPGGRVLQADSDRRLLDHCRGLTPDEARRILGAQLKPALAMGYWVAAARCLFEQTGVVVAAPEAGGHCSQENISAEHALPAQAAPSFEAFLRHHRLVCDLGRLVYFSRWQTGAGFDERFFIAALPAGQQPVPRGEAAELLWLAPDDALQRFRRREPSVAFEIYATMRTLADFETIDSVMREYEQGKKRASGRLA